MKNSIESSYLFPFLLAHRRKLTVGQRKAQARKIKKFKPKYPYSIERDYTRVLNSYIDTMYNGVYAFIDANYSTWLDGERRDDDISDLREYITQYLEKEYGVVDDFVVDFLVGKASQIDAFNLDDWSRFTGTVIGVDTAIAKVIVPSTSTYIEKAIKEWTDANYELWNTVTNDFIDKTTSIIRDNVRSNVGLAQTKQDLLKVLPKKKGQLDYNRAKLIARDQTGTLQSHLNKNRMEDAGVSFYDWWTVGDERVRGNPSGKNPNAIPSHDIMDGKCCDWRDASIISDDGGKTWRDKKGKEEKKHVGMAINCRCSGVAVLDELMSAVDKVIENEPDFGIYV